MPYQLVDSGHDHTILAPSKDTDQRIVYPVHGAYQHTMVTRISTTANFGKAGYKTNETNKEYARKLCKLQFQQIDIPW